MVPVVVERDPQIAVDGELAKFGVQAHPTSLLLAQIAHRFLPMMSTSGTKKSPFSKRLPTSSSEGMRA